MAQNRKHIFRLSDLFLILGFAPMVVFLIFGAEFMQFPNPDDVALKIYWIAPCLVFMVLAWGIYIYLELEKGNCVNRAALYIFIILMIIGVIGILMQDQEFSIDTFDKAGNPITVSVELSDTHIVFFTGEIIGILLFVYIGVFIFPKRFHSVWPIKIFGYAVFFLCFTLTIHSYIIETAKYPGFIKALIECDETALNANSTYSVILNQNSLGMVLMVGMLFCYINHSLSKHRWFYWPMAIYFYLNMIFTFCRTALGISAILFFVYLYYVLIHTMRKYPSLNSFFLVFITLILIATTVVVLLSILSEGKYIEYFYNLYRIFANDDSMESRRLIWTNTYQIIAQTLPMSLIFGRGFGTMNVMLLAMNEFKKYLFPTHNGYLNLLAEGGLPYILSFILLLGYVISFVVKNYKTNPRAAVALTIGLLSFAIYSLNETIHYFTYPFMFLIFVYDNAKVKPNF